MSVINLFEGRLHLFFYLCVRTKQPTPLAYLNDVTFQSKTTPHSPPASTNAVLFCHPVLACDTYSSGEKNGGDYCDLLWLAKDKKQTKSAKPRKNGKRWKICLIFGPVRLQKMLTSSKINLHDHTVVPQAAGFLFHCLSGYNIIWRQPQQRQLRKPFCNKYFSRDINAAEERADRTYSTTCPWHAEMQKTNSLWIRLWYQLKQMKRINLYTATATVFIFPKFVLSLPGQFGVFLASGVAPSSLILFKLNFRFCVSSHVTVDLL